MRKSKFNSGQKLIKVNLDTLPTYLKVYKTKYINWLE